MSCIYFCCSLAPVFRHTCNECGKAFKIQKQLQNHLRVHEENKAKIQELNKQIQTLMQMNGELAQNGIRKAQRRRRRQPSVTGKTRNNDPK